MFPRDPAANREIRAEQMEVLELHVASGECPETHVNVDSFFACPACRRLHRINTELMEAFQDAKSMKAGA